MEKPRPRRRASSTEALRYLRGELLKVLKNLAVFAERYKATPTLGYTHYQPAQLVTVGKRATLWMQDLQSDLKELDFVLGTLRFLGCRGTTGTEASFLELFEGDETKIDELNRRIAAEFDFTECFPVCGQTYPRKTDSRILNCLSAIGQSAYRMAQDIRLLQHDRQLEEPFEENQIGSSAMAYKRNPMRCERICSLSRYLMTEAINAPLTASAQWLERTLDDSANRRLSLPESFLCADAVLRLLQNVSGGLHVNEKIVDKTVREYLPFIATENLLMEAVKRGGDRQQPLLHGGDSPDEGRRRLRSALPSCRLPGIWHDEAGAGSTAGACRLHWPMPAAGGGIPPSALSHSAECCQGSNPDF